MKSALVLLMLLGLATSLSVRKKRHENEGKKNVVADHKKIMICLPLKHVCQKNRWSDCCSGYCGMAHSGPGSIAIMQMMKYGTCMNKYHKAADHGHHKGAKKMNALEAGILG